LPNVYNPTLMIIIFLSVILVGSKNFFFWVLTFKLKLRRNKCFFVNPIYICIMS